MRSVACGAMSDRPMHERATLEASRRLRDDLVRKTRFAPQKKSRTGRGKRAANCWSHLNGPLIKSLRLSTGLLFRHAAVNRANVIHRRKVLRTRAAGHMEVIRSWALVRRTKLVTILNAKYA